MSINDQRAFGHDCAHEDIRGQMEPCVTIEDARRRIASMYAGDNVSAEDIEACAQGYLAGWASALPATKPVAPAWGPFPTAAEVTAHVAAHPPLPSAAPWATGAPWLRLSGNGDLSVIYLAVVDGVVRARFGGLPEWHELEFGRAGMWRPTAVHAEAVDERDAAFTRGLKTMREAAANLATTTARGSEAALYHAECEASGSQWSMGGFMASRIRALKVAP